MIQDNAQKETAIEREIADRIDSTDMYIEETAAPQVFHSHSPEETYLLGKQLGEQCRPGQVYTLTGDLGVGKTLFTQGFAAGLGISEPVNSPTFTILQMYDTGRLPFYHFDVYRIGDVEEMEEIGWEDYIYGQGVCMVEWAELVEEILPKHRVHILIEKDLAQGFDYRRITLDKKGSYALRDNSMSMQV